MIDLKTLNELKDDAQFSVAEAARFCGVSYGCFLKWTKMKKIKCIRIGSRITVEGREIKKAVVCS